VRHHFLFKEVRKELKPSIQPDNPVFWRSPENAMTQEFSSWDRHSAM
jgi:hypothetical protein